MLGPLTRHLPLRATLDPRQSFESFAGRLHEQIDSMLEWQDYYPAQSLSTADGRGFLPWGFSLVCVPEGLPEVERYTALEERFHLHLAVRRQGGRWQLELLFDPARFSSPAMATLLGQLRTLLTAELGIDPARLVPVLYFGGDPITARFIAGEIGGRLGAARIEPLQKVVS